ncbi:MAG: aminopeptidase P family protein [Armatimonadetes bacterium]|nr:aminopeptidase P family protein [Armatimonadota bacterium]
MSPLSSTITADRLTRLRARLADAGVEAVVLTKPENLTYVTGFAGSAGVAVISQTAAHLIVDFRYIEQAASQAPHVAVGRASGPLLDAAAAVLRQMPVHRVGVEGEVMPVAAFRRLQAAVEGADVVPLDGVDHLRWQKDPEELAAIRRATEVAEAAFADVLPLIRPGAVERDIAVELECRLRRRGSERVPFDVIVASGPRSSLPHGVASDRVIGAGEFVTVDFGAVVGGYHSDCTRTVVTEPAGDRHREIYHLVLGAQQAALDGLRPGMTGREADALARMVIAEAGYGDAFGHSLGHGVGLAVHEGPTLSPREEAVLAPGAVVTVEPGVYLSGWGGVRIEDLVVLTENGCEVLTRSPRSLHEVRA